LFIFFFRFFFVLSAQSVRASSNSVSSDTLERNPFSKTGFEANPKGKLGKIKVVLEDPAN
jgi:hypothetical protein